MFEFYLDKAFLSGRQVLSGINFRVAEGETHCLLGPSGSGKTTLLNLMAGLAQDQKGVNCSPAVRLNNWQPCMPDIGYLFQQPRLLPWRTIMQNLLLVEPDPDVVHALLEQVRLQDYVDYFPSQISLGMARRVALVRCLLIKPDVVLMDEPLTSLDLPTAREMRVLIKRLVCNHTTRSMIYVTHDLDEALELGDHVSILGNEPAQIIYSGRIGEVSRAELECLLKH